MIDTDVVGARALVSGGRVSHVIAYGYADYPSGVACVRCGKQEFVFGQDAVCFAATEDRYIASMSAGGTKIWRCRGNVK
jgi:hypothetical protein